MTSWHSYPSIFALGHRALAELLLDDVIVEEKIDGSQFSFGRFSDYPIDDGYLCRSKGAQLNITAPEKMFQKAVDYVTGLDLRDGWTYRAEYLQRPKHNALAYNRAPANNLIIFDINPSEEEYLSWAAKAEESARIGLETVPRYFNGRLTAIECLREMLSRESVLGGQKIEGVVIKNYHRFGPDKKVLMGKFVSEDYKEVHAKEWKAANPTKGDVMERLVEKYRTPARWQKALIHLREQGKIEDSPRDIGMLMKEVWPDVDKECQEDIKDALYAWATQHLRRGVTRGLPDWYKELLMKKQFERGE
jgi:RNA ligase